MPVRTDRCDRPGRARALWVLLLPAVLGSAACAKDICKATDLSHELLCGSCKPKDNELLARLQPTDLPYPLRKVVLRCAEDIHGVTPPGADRKVVTKQNLIDCINAEPSLDAATKASLAYRVNGSTLIDQKGLDDWHEQCLVSAAPVVAPAPGTDAPAAATPASSTPATPTPVPTPSSPAPTPVKPAKPAATPPKPAP